MLAIMLTMMLGMSLMITMAKINFVENMNFNGDHDLSFYDKCMCDKYHCTPFPLNGSSHAMSIIELVHVNFCGPMATFHGRENIF
jgi:hypothetical protein